MLLSETCLIIANFVILISYYVTIVMALFLKMLFHLILSPSRGWEDVVQYDPDPRRLMTSGLYPVFAMAAVSVFIVGFYDPALTFVGLLQRAIITYVQYFISYYIAQFVFAMFIRRYVSDGEVSDDRIGVFISIGLGLLAVLAVIMNCLPVELSLVQFLPVYVAVILWKGAPYLNVRDDKMNQFVILSVASIIAPVYLLALLNLLLN